MAPGAEVTEEWDMSISLGGREVMGWDVPVNTNGASGLGTRVGYVIGVD
jgi:hypothetical protein